MKVKSLSSVRLWVNTWTAAYQAPPSMGFSRQKYWSGVPLPSPNHILFSALILKISFLLLTRGFFISSFSGCFRCRVSLFIWRFSYFLRYACIAMNLPLSTAFTVSHRFWVVFIFIHFCAYFDFFFDLFCDLLVIQQRVVQPPYVGIFNSFSPVIEI